MSEPTSTEERGLASLGVALVGLVLAANACSEPAPPDPTTSILLVTVDTTRADRIGCYGRPSAGTPTLDALAERGARFDRAYATVPITLPSHASILTGSYPPYHGIRDNGLFVLDERIDTLAEVCRRSGMRTAAFISAFPLFGMFGLDQGFELYDDTFEPTRNAAAGHMRERPAGATVASAIAWLDGLTPDERFFAWVHLFDPHDPLQAPEPFASRHADDPYQAEIAYADASIGELVGAIERLSRTGRTVIAVTSDHGESLGDHGEQTHAILLYDSTLRVPWIMAGPGIAPAAIEAPVSLIDLAPTLAHLAGLPANTSLSQNDGVSLAPVLAGGPDDALHDRELYFETFFPRLHHGWSELVGLAQGEWKYVEALGARDASGRARAELFRPASDPAESNDLALSEPDAVQDLGLRLDALRQRLDAESLAAERRDVASEELESLDALGYGGLDLLAPELSADVDAEPGRDPRKVAEAVTYLNAVRALALAGRFDEALRQLARLTAIDPGGVAELEATGDLFLARGRTRTEAGDSSGAATEDLTRAAAAFGRATELKPGRRGLWVRRAEALNLLGELDEALRCIDRAMELAPPNERLLRTRAQILARLGSRAQD